MTNNADTIRRFLDERSYGTDDGGVIWTGSPDDARAALDVLLAELQQAQQALRRLDAEREQLAGELERARAALLDSMTERQHAMKGHSSMRRSASIDVNVEAHDDLCAIKQFAIAALVSLGE